MPTVYKFPPVRVSAYENTIDDPQNVSVGIGGAARGSQTRVNRTIYTAMVNGAGTGGDATGYVEVLKHLLKGKLPLVQMDTLPAIWWGRSRGRGALISEDIAWTSGGTDLVWLDGDGDIEWSEKDHIECTSGFDSFDYIDVTGIADGTRVYVGEAVQGGGSIAYVTRPATVGSGSIRVFLTGPIPSGRVSIGAKVTRVFRLLGQPRATQTTGAFSYNYNMIEVLGSDFSEDFTVLDPWT